MNAKDMELLTDVWHADTNYLNSKIDEQFRATQDHAYALGRKRGRIDASEAMTDADIFDVAEAFGEFQYGDAQGHKRIAFARALFAAASLKVHP